METAFDRACNEILAFEESRLCSIQAAFLTWETIILNCYNIERTATVNTLFDACRLEALTPPQPGICSLSAWEAFVSYFDQEFVS